MTLGTTRHKNRKVGDDVQLAVPWTKPNNSTAAITKQHMSFKIFGFFDLL